MQLSTSLRLPSTGVRSLVGEIAPRAGPAPRGRVWPARALAVAGAGVLAFLLISHAGGFIDAIDHALHISWELVTVAVALEAASVAGYVVLLHRVVARADGRLRPKDSYDIALGGAAATRFLPTAGLGGAAVTVWALRARGVRSSELTERLLAFLLLLYSVYIAALLAGGVAVAFGLVRVAGGTGLGIAGAAIAIAVAATIVALFAAPSRLAPAMERLARRSGRVASVSRRTVSQLPSLRASLGRAWHELRRPHPALVGALAYWAFDTGVLVTMLHAFGVKLPLAAVVLAYFLGSLLNVVPLPGSLSGGLVGCLIALGSPAGAAIAAVLSYRALAVWLPAIPGVAALASLRASVKGWRAGTASRTPTRQLAV